VAEPELSVNKKRLTEALVEARLLTTDKDSAGRRWWPWRTRRCCARGRRLRDGSRRTGGSSNAGPAPKPRRGRKEAPEARKSELLAAAGLLLRRSQQLAAEHRADLGREQEFITPQTHEALSPGGESRTGATPAAQPDLRDACLPCNDDRRRGRCSAMRQAAARRKEAELASQS